MSLFFQMRMSYDDQYLFTVSEDACLFIFKAVDKEGRGMKRDKEVGYAEEILITKSDLEEKVRTKIYFQLLLCTCWGKKVERRLLTIANQI